MKSRVWLYMLKAFVLSPNFSDLRPERLNIMNA